MTYRLGITNIIATMVFVSGMVLSVGNVSASSPPGVVDIFVTTNAYSYVDTYNVQNPLVPNVGAVKTIYVNGRVTDGDGVGTGFADGDLDYVELRLYRELAGAGCMTDVNDCYQTFCTVTPNSSTVLNYSCLVEISYVADSTMSGGTHAGEVWNAEVLVEDDSEQLASSIKAFEMQTLLALGIPSTLDFGTLQREQATTNANNTEYVLTQQGNDVASVRVSGGSMTCSVNGTIPVSSIQWSLTDVGYGNPVATDLSGTPADVGLSVGTDDDVALTKSLYFNIILPEIVSGVCSGNMSIEATSV